MTDQDLAIANRDRIGRLYGYTAGYRTGTVEPEEPPAEISVKEEQKAEEQEQEQEHIMNAELVFNRFNRDSVAGRMLVALAAGPKTSAQIAQIAKAKSPDNILAPGGWFYQLRKFGKTTGKFRLEKDGKKLVLSVSKRYAKQV